ncbi:hypothetical protein LCL95_04290 [Bacillus timonensis]|nr:hypothetical protein [Bacillus timonensis]
MEKVRVLRRGHKYDQLLVKSRFKRLVYTLLPVMVAISLYYFVQYGS